MWYFPFPFLSASQGSGSHAGRSLTYALPTAFYRDNSNERQSKQRYCDAVAVIIVTNTATICLMNLVICMGIYFIVIDICPFFSHNV